MINGQASSTSGTDRLPLRLRDITFDLYGPGRSPSVITALGEVLRKFPDVFSTSKTDLDSCSPIPFKVSVSPDSAPVASRPYRINPLIAKRADTVLDQYLAAGLIYPSTSLFSSYMVACLKKDGNVRITTNSKKLNAISSLGKLLIRRVDEVVDALGKHLVPSFHQFIIDEDIPPLTAFCTLSPEFSNGSSCHRVAVLHPVGSSRSKDEAIKYLERVAA